MSEITDLLESSAEQVLLKMQPKVHEIIKAAIHSGDLTPKQIDDFVYRRYGWPKGHVVREACYMAAKYFQHHPAETQA